MLLAVERVTSRYWNFFLHPGTIVEFLFELHIRVTFPSAWSVGSGYLGSSGAGFIMDFLSKFPAAIAAIDQLREEMGATEGEVTSSPLEGAGGSYGEMHQVMLSDSQGQEKCQLIVKLVPDVEGKKTLSKVLGLPREAAFFNTFAPTLSKVIGLPKVWHSEGDVTTGEKVVVMERLANVTQSGYFFGPGSPLNQGKDLPKICAEAGNPHCKDVAAATFRAAAEVHARYWHDESLLGRSWLRGSSWVQGQGEEAWKQSQQTVKDSWKVFHENREKGELTSEWPEDLVTIVDAAVGKISWESFQSAKRPWTLVHGDFHPANIMWRNDTTARSSSTTGSHQQPVFLDWEMVGLGSGPQELGQYVISHMDPVVRSQCEEELVRGYYEHLVSAYPGSKACDYTWEECWSEYKLGGVGRWMWFLPYFASRGPKHYLDFFINQVGAFLRDHCITAETVEQPRA